jgi:predicted site-specific integrase-resolvase
MMSSVIVKDAPSRIVKDPPVRLSRAASELGISIPTLRNWCISGKVRSYRLGNLIVMPTSEIQRLSGGENAQ